MSASDFDSKGGTATPPAFETRDLRFRYVGAARRAVDGVTLEVPSGTLYGIIGPNGSGKSTLLKLMLGALEPGTGSVRYAGTPLKEWSRRALARRVGVVHQGEELAFPISVRQLVAMGRYPHLGALGRPGPNDRAAISEALARCDVAELADRPISRLSGGERQRALIARALAQRPETLVLDEPTISLDIRHEMTIFELLAQLAARDGVTVMLVTHNLNLAARYADHLLLLDRGGAVAEGRPREVLTRDVIERVYRWSVVISPHPGRGPDAGSPQVTPLAGDGERD